jgi:serine/threonine protein kinase
MRYIHSQEIIHGDLTPGNIWLESANRSFGQSIARGRSEIPSLSDSDPVLRSLPIDIRDLIPECDHNRDSQESEVD